MKKYIIGALIGILAVVGIVVFSQKKEPLLKGFIPSTIFKTSSSTAMTVGSGNSSTILATSTNRIWAAFTNYSGTCRGVWLNFNQGAVATTNKGVFVNASTTYEIDVDNLYVGSVTAITDCSASSTLIVTEGLYGN